MRIRLGMIVLAVLCILGGTAHAEAHSATHKGQSYRARVLAGTVPYPACVKLRSTTEGRVWFSDMVSDTYDDGRKRSAYQQIRYVREGCREMTR